MFDKNIIQQIKTGNIKSDNDLLSYIGNDNILILNDYKKQIIQELFYTNKTFFQPEPIANLYILKLISEYLYNNDLQKDFIQICKNFKFTVESFNYFVSLPGIEKYNPLQILQSLLVNRIVKRPTTSVEHSNNDNQLNLMKNYAEQIVPIVLNTFKNHQALTECFLYLSRNSFAWKNLNKYRKQIKFENIILDNDIITKAFSQHFALQYQDYYLACKKTIAVNYFQFLMDHIDSNVLGEIIQNKHNNGKYNYIDNEIIPDLVSYLLSRNVLDSLNNEKEIYILNHAHELPLATIKKVYLHLKKTDSEHLLPFINKVIDEKDLSYQSVYNVFKNELHHEKVAESMIDNFYQMGTIDLASLSTYNVQKETLYIDTFNLIIKHNKLSKEELLNNLRLSITNEFIRIQQNSYQKMDYFNNVKVQINNLFNKVFQSDFFFMISNKTPHYSKINKDFTVFIEHEIINNEINNKSSLPQNKKRL